MTNRTVTVVCSDSGPIFAAGTVPGALRIAVGAAGQEGTEVVATDFKDVEAPGNVAEFDFAPGQSYEIQAQRLDDKGNPLGDPVGTTYSEPAEAPAAPEPLVAAQVPASITVS